VKPVVVDSTFLTKLQKQAMEELSPRLTTSHSPTHTKRKPANSQPDWNSQYVVSLCRTSHYIYTCFSRPSQVRGYEVCMYWCQDVVHVPLDGSPDLLCSDQLILIQTPQPTITRSSAPASLADPNAPDPYKDCCYLPVPAACLGSMNRQNVQGHSASFHS